MIQDKGYLLDTRYRIHDTRYRIHDTGYKIGVGSRQKKGGRRGKIMGRVLVKVKRWDCFVAPPSAMTRKERTQ